MRQQQSHSLSKTEIIISGLPISFTNPYEEIVKYTFDAIGASQLLIQVLGIRRFINKPPQQNSNPPSHFSLAVHVNGHDIALKLISLKMNFKELKLSQVFKNPALEGLLYLNILYPPHIHSLLKKTRTVARCKNYKYAWIRSGIVYVRKDDNLPAIPIHSELDLQMLP